MNSMIRIGPMLLLSLVVGWMAAAAPANDLISAADRADAAAVNALLTKGADVDAKDKDGRTALMLASRNGYLDVVQGRRQRQR